MTADEAKDFYLNKLKLITRKVNRSISYVVSHNKVSKMIAKYGYVVMQIRTSQQRHIVIRKKHWKELILNQYVKSVIH